jgi:hypothetical protein
MMDVNQIQPIRDPPSPTLNFRRKSKTMSAVINQCYKIPVIFFPADF